MQVALIRFALSLYKREKLAGSGFFPMPRWLHRFLLRYPLPRRIAVYAQIVKDEDLSSLAPDELGCAEAVSRLVSALTSDGFPGAITGTWTLNEKLLNTTSRVKLLSRPENGCIVMAATGTGTGALKNGHVGVYVNGYVWSNNSFRGKWDDHFSYDMFVARYRDLGGFPIRHYRLTY